MAETWWKDAPLVSASPPEGGERWWDAAPVVEGPAIDFSKPVGEVRKAIGKLPPEQRQAALDEWAKTYVAKEREQGGIGQAIDNTVRTLARGTFVGPWLDEATAASSSLLDKLGLGGAPYDETLAYQRAKDKAFDEANPVLSVAGQVAGGLAGGGAALKAGGNIVDKGVKLAAGGPLAAWAPAESIAGRTVQGAITGAAYGANAGAGNAEGDRLEGATTGASVGAGVGAVAPHIIQGGSALMALAADKLSPQIARVQGNLAGLRDRLAIKASADGAGPAVSPGADAAAEQIIANQAARANLTPAMLRQRFAAADEAARMGSGSSAQNVLAPVDIDPSMQRLAGSVARQHPEADNMGRAFQFARQTGQPSGLEMPPNANIPTRPAMALRLDEMPNGQFERVADGLRKALQIEKPLERGTAKSAFEAEGEIVSRARMEAKRLYNNAYTAAKGIDVRPHIIPVIERWVARAAEEPAGVGRAINGMLKQFASADGQIVNNLPRFQKAKEFGDGLIAKYFESAEGRNRYVGGVLNELKKELLEAVDNIPGAGSMYKAARNQFSDEMTLRNALQLGRDAFRDNSEVVAEQYRRLATEGERKLFRLGLYDGFVQQMGRKGRTNDVTQFFQSPRVQEILEAVIPREKPGQAFADRPERFGRFIANEQKMISTRNQTMGNSKTAERLADDEALNNMQSMIDAAKSAATGSASNVVLRVMENVAQKLLGFRADTAAAIAQKLYTASPLEREKFLMGLERRMGPGRAAQFARLMAEHVQGFQQAGAAGAAGVAGTGP